jgi:hypothetical protein
MHLAQDRDQWLAVVNTIMNLHSYLLIYLLTYLLTYLLRGVGYYLKS